MAMRLEIVLDDNGRIGIEGPRPLLRNKLLCLGLLEAAKDAVREYGVEEPRIVPATALRPVGKG